MKIPKIGIPEISAGERRRTGKFLLGIALAFVALFIATAAVPVLWLEYATAVPASALLNAIGANCTASISVQVSS